ncbi:MAG: hypothetical protein AABY89_06710 [Acidobacteriota bacterium]
MRRWLTVTCLAGLVLAFWPRGAEAIPAFARRYQTSCTTCHVLIPKLNAFGIAFRNNGYRIPANDEKFVKTPDVQLGAPAWKRVWPDAVWPGGIPGIPPIAIRIFSDVVINPSTTSKVNFIFPNEFEILAVGTAGDHISYLGELEITTGDRVDLARAFIQFDQIFGSPVANLVVGRFEPRAVPFSRFHRRLTPSDFLATEFRNVSEGFDFKTRQAGFEFWGAKTGSNNKGGVEYAAGIVNGNGPFADNNTSKDLYYRLSYKVGGFGVAGSTEETEELKQSNNWRDNSIRLGTSGYFGKGQFAGKLDEFYRVGGDVDIFLRDLNVSTWVFMGRDDFTATKTVTDFTAVAVEANYVAKPWLIGVLRYDAVFRDKDADIKRVVPAVVIAIRANVRLVADWEVFLKNSGDTRARVRVDLLF